LKPSRQKSKRGSPPPALSRKRLWIFRLTAFLLPVVLVVALEISLHVSGYGYDPHFFKRIKIGTEEYFVQNDDFSYRFFPPETARNPGPIRMPVHKAPGTYRIFVLGESAAMGDPEPAFGAYRYLEMMLRKKYPDKKFEIINVAFTAINSHVIVPPPFLAGRRRRCLTSASSPPCSAPAPDSCLRRGRANSGTTTAPAPPGAAWRCS